MSEEVKLSVAIASLVRVIQDASLIDYLEYSDKRRMAEEHFGIRQEETGGNSHE